MGGVKIRITDHAPPPFKVESEALSPHVEFVFLNSWNEKDFDPQILRSLDAANLIDCVMRDLPD